MNFELHHIGFVVDDIEKNIHMFELFGFEKEGSLVEDFNQNNYLQIMIDSKQNRIELIKPMNEKSTVNKDNLGLHHLAFITDNKEELLELIRTNKVGKIFTNNIPAPLFDNRNVSFGFLKNNLIFEIIEE